MAEIAGSEKRQGLHLACFRRTAIESKENSPPRPPKMPIKCESQVSRQLRLLRAHSIIHKISGRNLYQVSELGRTTLTTFLIARVATANQLMKKAA